jgi:hypothetical protein
VPAVASVVANPRLDLDARYRYIATEILGRQQFFNLEGPLDDGNAYQDVVEIPVEGSVGELVVSVSFDGYCACNLALRDPANALAPIFQYTGRHAVWRVPTPQSGTWTLTIAIQIPQINSNDSQAPAQAAGTSEAQVEYLPEYYVQSAVASDVTLDVDFPVPEDERTSGVPMPIIAGLTDTGPIVGATVNAFVQTPAGLIYGLTLYDDGMHEDGAAGDGLYGNTFYQTGLAGDDSGSGSYNVTVVATGNSSLAGAFVRQKILSFFIYSQGDEDGDGLPDEYEERYGDDPTSLDPTLDPDNDGRTTGQEFEDGTDPTRADTDGGGESDGSETSRGGDPLDPSDDSIQPTWTAAHPGVSKVFVRYAPRAEYTKVEIYKADSFAGPYTYLVDDATASGMITDTAVVNDQEYCYFAIGVGAGVPPAKSAPLTPSCTTPKADPWPPTGFVLINDGASTTTSVDVQLGLSASDEVFLHYDSPEDTDNIMLPPYASATGVTEMRVSNQSNMDGVAWESFAPTKPWTLDTPLGLATVFAQFRDAAGNESLIVSNAIWVVEDDGTGSGNLYLPVVRDD